MADETVRPAWLTDACLDIVAKAVRHRRMIRTSAGRAFDPSIPPTENELDDARAALLAVAPFVAKAAAQYTMARCAEVADALAPPATEHPTP